ncbi:hypothetical protein [Halomonas ventosae]|uniref:hypothetical protein n=1 Tax=Halomonas ventosae TaxID=229007 RepID=UPI0015E79A43|nr:hypothetical protein [Halomonas ventosae]
MTATRFELLPITGLHVFTFNRVAATRRWRRSSPPPASRWPDRQERRHSVTAGQEM